MSSIRLLAVNARTLALDRHELAALIAAQGPDVACVHGAPSLLRWRSICAALAREAGLVVVGGGQGAGENLLLSSLGVDVVAFRDLAFRESSARRPLGAALAVLEHGGSTFTVAAARVVGNSVQRVAQVSQLHEGIAQFAVGSPPAVLSVEGADRGGTSSSHALADGRHSLGAGLYVDEPIAVEQVEHVEVSTEGFPPLLVRLTLP